jgi:hypothetical protein
MANDEEEEEFEGEDLQSIDPSQWGEDFDGDEYDDYDDAPADSSDSDDDDDDDIDEFLYESEVNPD